MDIRIVYVSYIHRKALHVGVRSRGADIVLHGANFPFALALVLQMAESSGCTFVPPFDDPEVIAGQGTVAMEILRQEQGPLGAIFVPVGAQA